MPILPDPSGLERIAPRTGGGVASYSVPGAVTVQPMLQTALEPLRANLRDELPKEKANMQEYLQPVTPDIKRAHTVSLDNNRSADAMSRLGGTVFEMAAKEMDNIAELQAMKKSVELSSVVNDLRSGENGFLKTKTDGVLKEGWAQGYKDEYDNRVESMASDLSPNAARKFNEVAARGKIGLETDMVKHAMIERDKFETEVEASTLLARFSSIQANPGDTANFDGHVEGAVGNLFLKMDKAQQTNPIIRQHAATALTSAFYAKAIEYRLDAGDIEGAQDLMARGMVPVSYTPGAEATPSLRPDMAENVMKRNREIIADIQGTKIGNSLAARIQSGEVNHVNAEKEIEAAAKGDPRLEQSIRQAYQKTSTAMVADFNAKKGSMVLGLMEGRMSSQKILSSDWFRGATDSQKVSIKETLDAYQNHQQALADAAANRADSAAQRADNKLNREQNTPDGVLRIHKLAEQVKDGSLSQEHILSLWGTIGSNNVKSLMNLQTQVADARTAQVAKYEIPKNDIESSFPGKKLPSTDVRDHAEEMKLYTASVGAETRKFTSTYGRIPDAKESVQIRLDAGKAYLDISKRGFFGGYEDPVKAYKVPKEQVLTESGKTVKSDPANFMPKAEVDTLVEEAGKSKIPAYLVRDIIESETKALGRLPTKEEVVILGRQKMGAALESGKKYTGFRPM